MPLIEPERCLCGRPLHYAKPAHQRFIQDQILRLGDDAPIRLLSKPGKGWWVPRHYLALHPFHSWELEALAERYAWKPVIDRRNAKNGPRRPKHHPLDWDGYPRDFRL